MEMIFLFLNYWLAEVNGEIFEYSTLVLQQILLKRPFLKL